MYYNIVQPQNACSPLPPLFRCREEHTCIHHLLNDKCFGTAYMCMPIVYNAIN